MQEESFLYSTQRFRGYGGDANLTSRFDLINSPNTFGSATQPRGHFITSDYAVIAVAMLMFDDI